jgi:hypothetical protein
MANNSDDLDELFDKRDAKLKAELDTRFAAFEAKYEAQRDAERTVNDAEEKRLDQAVANVSEVAQGAGRVLENHRFIYQTMIAVIGVIISLLSIVGVAGTIFGVRQYADLSELGAQIRTQSEYLKKQQTEIDSARMQDLHFRIEAALEQAFTDLDSTLESLSPIEPHEELLVHQRNLALDRKRIARVKEDLEEFSKQNSSEQNVNSQDTKISSQSVPSLKDLQDLLKPDRQVLDVVTDTLPLVDKEVELIKSEYPQNLLDSISVDWERLYDRIKHLPVEREELSHIAGYCQEALGSIEAQRASKSGSEDQTNNAVKFYHQASTECRSLARAKANEATMLMGLYRTHLDEPSIDKMSMDDAKKRLKELDQIVALFSDALETAPTQWLIILFKENLAVALMERADFKWERINAEPPSVTTFEDDANLAHKAATEVWISPSGDPEFFVFSADIVCAQLQFTKLENGQAYKLASSKWPSIEALLRNAKAHGYEMPQSLDKLFGSYPHLAYISGLGEDIKENLRKIISE